MSAKVTEIEFIEAVENNDEGLNNQELAAKLGITEQWFYKLRNKYRDKLKDAAIKIIQNNAADLVRDLLKQSRDGKTQATLAGLEMLEIKKKDSLFPDSDKNKWKIIIEKNYDENNYNPGDNADA